MLRDGAITFGDLTGKPAQCGVVCGKCHRAGNYRVAGLIHDRGRDDSQ